MSRLDYITIAIVAICLALLIYLLVRIANINKPVSNPATEIEQVDTLSHVPEGTDPIVDSLMAPIEQEDSVPLPQKETEGPTLDAGGEKNFLVVAASFNTKELADQELNRLVKLGYKDCEIGYFNQQQIVSVIAGRFDTYEKGEALANKMKADHKVEAYVHEKRSQ